MQPFVSEGRTFLPVRGIADAFGADVHWVAATQTVYLNTITPAPTPAPIPQPTPPPMPTPPPRVSLFDAAPAFEGSSQWSNAMSTATVNMQGNPFIDSLRTRDRPSIQTPTVNGWTHHNLNNQYNLLTGTVGRIDGSSTGASNIIFIGDGRQLASFVIDGNTSPLPISVDITGISILRIEVNQPRNGAWVAFTNALIE
jgi:hypothetical protein